MQTAKENSTLRTKAHSQTRDRFLVGPAKGVSPIAMGDQGAALDLQP
jgi:hypothetical protein